MFDLRRLKQPVMTDDYAAVAQLPYIGLAELSVFPRKYPTTAFNASFTGSSRPVTGNITESAS